MRATTFSSLNISRQAGHKASFSGWQGPDAAVPALMVCLHLLDVPPFSCPLRGSLLLDPLRTRAGKSWLLPLLPGGEETESRDLLVAE